MLYFDEQEIEMFAKKHYRQMKKRGYRTWNGRYVQSCHTIIKRYHVSSSRRTILTRDFA